MLIKEEIEKAIRIHGLAYRFLSYITKKIDSGAFTFSKIHDGSSSSDVVFSWVNDYYDYLPTSILPNKKELREFSNYFASYLTTSFELSDKPMKVYDPNGCFCDICLQLTNLSHLKSKSPNKTDRLIAQQRKYDTVNKLALNLGVNLTSTACKDIVDLKANFRKVAYFTYMTTLLERIQFSKGGVYILALWREFAWSQGSPIYEFELNLDDILNAEQNIKQAILNKAIT